MSGGERRGVLLMTYGSPASLEREDIRSYLARVRGGREPDPELVDEFTRRYRLIGGSPLIGITRSQAAALGRSLGWPVEVGMRFSDPSILDGLSALAGQGVQSVRAIVLSPQYSPLLMGGYARAIDEARVTLGDRAPHVDVAGAWHEQPAFVEALADRLTASLARPSSPGRDEVAVLMTAHSLPRRVADQEPEYLAQLRATASAVAAKAGLGDEDWSFCWQSAGHEPGEWMQPDFADLMPEIAAAGRRSVVVVPVQFLADHLEILYDIDVGAREQADACGLAFRRIESLNADPGLIEALAAVARRASGARSEADRTIAVEALLRQAKEAHGVFEATELRGVYDQDWPRWYAAYAVEHGIGAILGAGVTIERLAEFLATTNSDLEATEPDGREPWAAYTARRITEDVHGA